MSLRVTTIGDGAMATICSMLLTAKGCRVTQWVRLAEDFAAFQAARENVRYLPGFKLPAELQLTLDDRAAFQAGGGCQLIVCAAPAQYIRGTLRRLAPHVPAAVPVVSVAKGIEVDTLLRPTQIVHEILGPRPIAALSGPNIAQELARQLPATSVMASEDDPFARRAQDLFTTRWLRVYRNHDLLGVELAGALKNVIAVAAGILDGMGMGNNCKAALLMRGLVEMTRLGVAMGAQQETFAGLAGLGDLVTTCVSPEGRNRTFGERVGRGRPPAEVLREIAGVVEGVATTKSVLALARRHGVEMPITEGLYAVLYEGKSPHVGIADLMARELKHEVDA